MPFRYPVCLELSGRRCVVVGGGEVAEHKTRGLLEAGADVRVLAKQFTAGLREMSNTDKVKLVRKQYSYGDLDGAFLAIAATDDNAVNAEVFREAEETKVLLNAVDDNEHCHFAVPSVIRRDDFLLTISTGGKAPALSKQLRRRLSQSFGSEYGELVELLGEVREKCLRRREVDFDSWAWRWAQAMQQDLLTMVKQGRKQEAAELVIGILEPDSSNTAPKPKPRVSIVGAGPGDPELISLRGRRLLDEADVIVYDRLVHPSLVEGKRGVYAGKEPGGHVVSQSETTRLLIELAEQGNRVVRLKGGDPFLFGRGSEEAQALVEAGIEFEVVPAPTSAIAGPAYAGIPVTDRRYSSSVAIVTGHCAGNKPVDFVALARSADTIVVLMGVSELDRISRDLISGGLDSVTACAIIENATLPEQRVVVGELADLPRIAQEADIKSPAMVVVGDVVKVRQQISWFNPTPAHSRAR